MAVSNLNLESTTEGLSIVISTICVYTLAFLGVSLDLFSYPPILFSSLLMIMAQLVIIIRVGLLSVPSVFCSFIIYPALIPLLSDHIFRVPNYTLRAAPYENQFMIEMGIFLVMTFVWVIAGISIANIGIKNTDEDSNDSFIGKYDFPYNPYSFIIVVSVILISAYLTTPGPTILTIEYEAVIDNYISWATFAGNLYMGSWIVLLLISRQTEDTTIKYVFYLITIGTVLWLLLHARRNEALGVLLVLMIVCGHQFRLRDIGSSLRTTVGSVFVVIGCLLLIIVGEIRSGSANFTLESLFIGDSPAGEVIKLPGGGHNFFGTFQFSLHYFYNEYLWGTTFLKYPIQSIPSPILIFIPISQPPYYFDIMVDNYALYNGGNYFLNEYFANFGPSGIILSAVIFGLVVSKANKIIAGESSDIWLGLCAAFVIAMPRSMWYWQGNWINAILGFIVSYILYFVIMNIYTEINNNLVADAQESRP